MSTEYLNIGELLPMQEGAALHHEPARATLRVLQNDPLLRKEFHAVELRKFDSNGLVSDVIVVDCLTDQVPNQNKAGIRVRERLALVYKSKGTPEVRPLRKDFPLGLHVNPTVPGETLSLCLYEEPWSSVERTWTPQRFLRLIQWWLAKTAEGKLHADDQAPEQLFVNAFEEVIVPPDFDSETGKLRNLAVKAPVAATDKINVFQTFLTEATDKPSSNPKFAALNLTLPPVIQDRIDFMPSSLGELHDRFAKLGVCLVDLLAERSKIAIPKGTEVNRDFGSWCVVILSVPLKLTATGQVKRVDLLAFVIKEGLCEFGLRTGAYYHQKGKISVPVMLGAPKPVAEGNWRTLGIAPVMVRRANTTTFVRDASGYVGEGHAFNGVLAGLGSLGSTLAEMWSKEAWGKWAYVDQDYIKPHNVLRHQAKHSDIGLPKTTVVQRLTQDNYQGGYYPAQSIAKHILETDDQTLSGALKAAHLVVDVTTTLEAPRDLARQDSIPRCCSLFLTPSGDASVTLLEDAKRTIRLDALEAQYYRAIISAEWGRTHLRRPAGVRVGSCREISARIPHSTIQLHGAILARQMQLLRGQEPATITVRTYDPSNGTIRCNEIVPQPAISRVVSEWRVVIDDSTRKKMSELRYANLPAETGGVIVGYTDQKTRTIYVVDILDAPADSKADTTGFTRGSHGLREPLQEIGTRTDGIVDYIGEWHSHPEFNRALPSSADRQLLDYLAAKLAATGEPALMIIIGTADEISLSVKAL